MRKGYHPGFGSDRDNEKRKESPQAAGRGELLRVRFKLLAKPQRGAAVRLQNDMEYLQLRNAQGRRLSFDFASEEVSR